MLAALAFATFMVVRRRHAGAGIRLASAENITNFTGVGGMTEVPIYEGGVVTEVPLFAYEDRAKLGVMGRGNAI